MKANKLLVRLIATVCVLGSSVYWGGIATCEAASVKIKGQPLGNISDIVTTVTGSEFQGIPKHSLLLFVRSCTNDVYKPRVFTQPRVFTINADGSRKKEYVLGSRSDYASTLSPRTDVVQKMTLALSKERTLFYGIAGQNKSSKEKYSRYGYRKVLTNGADDNAAINADTAWDGETAASRNIWGSCNLTIKGMEDREIFAYLHSSVMAKTGNLYLSVVPSSGTLTIQNGDSLGFKLFDYNNGIRAVDIAAGDFDGDGCKNDFVVAWSNDDEVNARIYTVTRTNDNKLNVTRLLDDNVLLVLRWGMAHTSQASVAALAGDFDGDGVDEAAIVTGLGGKPGSDGTDLRVQVYNRNKDGSWSSDRTNAYNDYEGTLKATKADLNGDGQDEIVILFFHAPFGFIYPRLEYWGFNKGSIKPIRNSQYDKGGSGALNLLGYYLAGNAYHEYYKTAEDFCITAGPLTGTMGKLKFADDIAISHVNSEASRVFVIPTTLDSNKNFAGFGDTKKVYEFIGNNADRRGAVITGNFANEGLVLEKPTHTVDAIDQSYGAVIQAMPYHVDNVDIYGNLMAYPENYTFSGFNGDEGNGKMTIRYTKTDTASTQNDVSFGMASTTETIALLGDAGETVHGGLQFINTAANIAGNFNEKAKAAGDTMNSIMELITDKIDQTTTNSTQEVKQFSTTSTMEAQLWDELLVYQAPQHIWRYKILNNPLPSWYQLGMKADYSSGNLNADSTNHYLTFTIYDSVRGNLADSQSMISNQNNTYQPRHEEGNFFSYPSDVKVNEGYNPSGELAEHASVAWSKNSPSSRTIRFSQSNIDSLKYDAEYKPSELTKTVSAIAAFFGAKDPNPLPPYTSHSETFQKKFSTSEQIDIELQGRSTIPGEEAGHQIFVMPFLAREGTMKVATAVHLDESGTTSRLWGADSLYGQRPDPALVLPGKYRRNGATIAAQNNNASAMQMRGLRFYVPAIDLHSDNNFLAGLTYTIRVPLYNASFKDTGNFDVKLSYAADKDFNISHPEKTMSALKAIQTVRMSLGGWSNATSDQNKGWAEFTWKVPDNLATGNYRFFVQIDPEGKLQEVHESRLAADGTIKDVGGNNDGYFGFVVTSVNDAKQKRSVSASALRAANKSLPSDGVLFREVYPGKDAGSKGESMRAALDIGDTSGTISIDLRFADISSDKDNVTFYMLLGLFAEGLGISEDASAPLQCTLRYDGDEYYPEAYLNGVNFKPGALENIALENIDKIADYTDMEDLKANIYLTHKIALVPHTTTTFMLNMTPRRIDWRNGSAFEIFVPELVAPAVAEDGDTDTGGDPDPAVDPTPDTPAVSTLGSSGGGCNALAGGFALLGLAGLAFSHRRKHR